MLLFVIIIQEVLLSMQQRPRWFLFGTGIDAASPALKHPPVRNNSQLRHAWKTLLNQKCSPVALCGLVRGHSVVTLLKQSRLALCWLVFPLGKDKHHQIVSGKQIGNWMPNILIYVSSEFHKDRIRALWL